MAITRRASASGVQSPSTNYVTVSKPAGTVSGDLMLAFVKYNLFGAVIPSGWTQIADSSLQYAGGWYGLQVFYKFAGGGEPASYNFYYSSNWGGGIVQLISYYGTYTTYPDVFDGIEVLTGAIGLNVFLAQANTYISGDLMVVGAHGYRNGDNALTGFSTFGGGYSNHLSTGNTFSFSGPSSYALATAEQVQTTAGWTPGGAAVAAAATNTSGTAIVCVRQANRTPLAPTPTWPPAGGYVDLAGGIPFSWIFNDPDQARDDIITGF